MWRHTHYPAVYSITTLYHIVSALKTSPIQRLPASQKETATTPISNIQIVHIQYMCNSQTIHLPPVQNITPCMLLERQPTVISRDKTTTFTGN